MVVECYFYMYVRKIIVIVPGIPQCGGRYAQCI